MPGKVGRLTAKEANGIPLFKSSAKHVKAECDFILGRVRHRAVAVSYGMQPDVAPRVIARYVGLKAAWEAEHPNDSVLDQSLALLAQARKEEFESLSPEQQQAFRDEIAEESSADAVDPYVTLLCLFVFY